jgi:hypothetical protein
VILVRLVRSIAMATESPRVVHTRAAAPPAACGGWQYQHDAAAVQATSKLPACFQRCFAFSYFNSIQSELLPVCFSDRNMVVAAPTGSGKTVRCSPLHTSPLENSRALDTGRRRRFIVSYVGELVRV